jgi:hypothetical protein
VVLGKVDHSAAKLAVEVIEVDEIVQLRPGGRGGAGEQSESRNEASHEPSFGWNDSRHRSSMGN